jgi:hypothetical protein
MSKRNYTLRNWTLGALDHSMDHFVASMRSCFYNVMSSTRRFSLRKSVARSATGIFLTLHAAMPSHAQHVPVGSSNLVSEVDTVRDQLSQLERKYVSAISTGSHPIISSTLSDSLATVDRIMKSKLPTHQKAELAGKVMEHVGEVFTLSVKGPDLFVPFNGEEGHTWSQASKDFSHRVFSEFLNDTLGSIITYEDPARAAITRNSTPDGKAKSASVFGFKDRAAREQLTQELIQKLDTFGQNLLQNYNRGERVVQEVYGNLEDMVKRSVEIKMSKAKSKKYTIYVYLGLAVFTLIHAPVDLTIERHFYSTLISSIVYFSVLISLAALKARSISSRSLEMLRKLSESLKSVDSRPEATLQELRILSDSELRLTPQRASSADALERDALERGSADHSAHGLRCDLLFI